MSIESKNLSNACQNEEVKLREPFFEDQPTWVPLYMADQRDRRHFRRQFGFMLAKAITGPPR